MRFMLAGLVALAACSGEPAPSNVIHNGPSTAETGDIAANVSEAAGAHANAAVPSRPLIGSGEQQVAQVIASILAMNDPRTWETARAAFQGARWQAISPLPPGDAGGTHQQEGTIRLGRTAFTVRLAGTRERVNSFYFSAQATQDREGVLAALRASGITWRRAGCLGHVNYREHVDLSAQGRSARLVMHEVISMAPDSTHGEADPNGAYDIDFGNSPERISAADSEQYCRY